MRLGIAIEETWDFFHEIYADLAEHHDTTLFKRRFVATPVLRARINRHIFRRDMQAFMRANDVVFFEWASELLATASHLPKTCGIVTRLHRYEMYQWADQINWDAVDQIILVSQEKQREFTGRFPGQASKVAVIPEAVSVHRFQPRSKPFAGDIGILCHLKPRKRVYELILAFYELTLERAGLHLHIGGGTAPAFRDYASALKSLVHKLDLGSKVTFHGHVANPHEWYRQIDIFISNGYSEGLQVAPMEAMACGCYTLSHRWDGAEELLPEENLFFTNAQLNSLILKYYDAPEAEREQQQARMRALVREKFNVDKTKLQVRQLVEGVHKPGHFTRIRSTV
jgi:glycosyltransferase involved in cell wall biosynthesis